MKKIILVSIFCLLLSGCFGGTPSNTTDNKIVAPDENSLIFQNEEFNISFPKEWDVIDKDEFTSNIPESTVVVFRNNVKNESFTPNVNIVRSTITEPIDSLEYGKMVFNRQSMGLTDFREINKIERELIIGGNPTKSTFLVFDARVKPGDSLIRYAQTYAVKKDIAYIITGSFLPDETQNTVQKIENIIKSFALK